VTEALVPTLHSRALRTNRYVYVVRSRRSGGVSVGINLDPQKTCNFDCVYCEVIDRKAIAKKTGRPAVEAGDVIAELARELDALAAGHEAVKAFAGDGEPSTFPGFLELSRRVFDERDARFLQVPVVLITNGSGLDREEMRRAHDLFSARGGVFWIKLDAGTEAFYRRVCRTALPFDGILSNLLAAARRHPVVVQSLFFRWSGEAPPPEEVEAWARRLADVVRGGGAISLVQVYTVARDTMEPGIEPLTKDELEEIADVARRASPGPSVETYA
jgi:pyruvate-formate lyase-activating enzyme